MLDFIDEEIAYETKNLFNVDWLTVSNTESIYRRITNTSFKAINELCLKSDVPYKLMDRLYNSDCIKIRQEIQNYAKGIYETQYRQVSLVELKDIGEVTDSYVENLITAGNILIINPILAEEKYYSALMTASFTANDAQMNEIIKALLIGNEEILVRSLQLFID
ncbi:MAG: hypothetical protein HEEMFOPI_02017 [Holosporales bacterium]